MKKAVLLCTIAASFACSCADMQEAPESTGIQLVLTAYQEGTPDAKTAVEDGGKQVFWEPGDEIKAFSGSRTGRFTANVSGLTTVAEFTGHLEGSDPDVADIWAVYPYSDEASFDGESITTVIPSVQVARPGTFAQGPMWPSPIPALPAFSSTMWEVESGSLSPKMESKVSCWRV